MSRCPMAIKFGVTLHTRCGLEAGHPDMHEGKGLEPFDFQRVSWLPGDRREYESARDDAHAWEGD